MPTDVLYQREKETLPYYAIERKRERDVESDKEGERQRERQRKSERKTLLCQRERERET